MTDADALEALADELIGAHGIPALVCANAGVAAGGPLLEGSLHDAHWVMEVNFFGVLGLRETLRAELPAYMGLSVLRPGLTSSRLRASGAQRPGAFGGPKEPQGIAKTIIERGMPADTVAERAFDGIAEGRFIIPTHCNARTYADARASEVDAAFETLSAIDTSSWDVSEAAASVLADLAAQADASFRRPDDSTDL